MKQKQLTVQSYYQFVHMSVCVKVSFHLSSVSCTTTMLEVSLPWTNTTLRKSMATQTPTGAGEMRMMISLPGKVVTVFSPCFTSLGMHSRSICYFFSMYFFFAVYTFFHSFFFCPSSQVSLYIPLLLSYGFVCMPLPLSFLFLVFFSVYYFLSALNVCLPCLFNKFFVSIIIK